MQVQVNTDDHIEGGESLSEWIATEDKSRLSRFQDHVTRLDVFLKDLDAGKSGANDKRCRIEARVTGRQPISVADDASEMGRAFISSVDKLARALDTDLGRAKDRHGRDTIRTLDASDAAAAG